MPAVSSSETTTAPADGRDSWYALTLGELPVGAIYDWCVHPSCGAVVLFSGTVRDHSTDDDGTERTGVTYLDYEAYEEEVEPKLAEIDDEIRRRWPSVRRVALLHRIGRLELAASSVVVAVSAAHRPEAFEAARFGIDTLKKTVPIWKSESWQEGDDVRQAWGLGAKPVVSIDDLSVTEDDNGKQQR